MGVLTETANVSLGKVFAFAEEFSTCVKEYDQIYLHRKKHIELFLQGSIKTKTYFCQVESVI
jgi:hypothetical protein